MKIYGYIDLQELLHLYKINKISWWMDQGIQATLGQWCILGNMSIGKLFIAQGLNNTLLAQVQYIGYN